MTDDLGRIEHGHVCKHGIRWPHSCEPCDTAAWELEKARHAARPIPTDGDTL